MGRRRLWRSVKCAILLLCVLPFLTACTPYRELKMLSVVQAVGIDLSQKGYYDMTFQIFNPQGAQGQNGAKGGGQSEAIIVQGNGSSAYDAIRNATLQAGKKLYFSNTQIYVMSEEFCKTRLPELVDFLQRPTEVRPVTRLVVARDGPASDILTAKKQGQIILSDEMEQMLENYGASSKMQDYNIEDFNEDESSGITDPAIPAIRVVTTKQGDQSLSMDGTAVFSNNKLAGFLDDTQTRGLLWVKGEVKSGIIRVAPREGGTVNLEIFSAGAKVKPVVKNGSLTMQVSVNFTSNIAQMLNAYVPVTDKQKTQELEQLQNEVVRKEIASAINTAMRDWDADIFGFGMKIYQQQPGEWKKISKQWDTYMKTMPVEVEINSKVVFTGMTTN